MTRPLRSVLFLPASNPRAIEKARGLACDAVVLDLEDAVGPDDKDAGRAAAVEAVRAGGFRAPTVAVRVNEIGSPWAEGDLAAVVEAAPGAVVAPKVGSGEGLRAYEGALCAAPEEVRLWAMIEISAALLNLREIASAGGRLQALVFGGNDMSKDLRRQVSANRAALHPAMAWTVAAARAHGLSPIDGVFNAIEDATGLEAECREGRDFGFDGKSLIHPSQIDVCNRVFTPSGAELAWARAVVAAFADPANAGKGVVRAGGQMAERLHLEQAQRMLAMAER